MNDTSTSGQSIKDMLAAQSPDQFEALKQVGTYYRLVRVLRSTGWLNLFLGGLTVLWGWSALRPNTFSTIQAILGAMTVGQSLLAIIRPRARGYLYLAVVLLLCGVWNLFLTVYISVSLRSVDVEWLIGLLGLYQVWGAYKTYKSYETFSKLLTPKPTSELEQQYRTIWEGLVRPSPALSPELMMVYLARRRWNGLLLPNDAILALKARKMLLFVSKPDLTLVPENPKSINKEQFAVFAQVDKESLMGKIYRNSYQLYMQWKGITNPEAELSKNLYSKRVGRKMLRWIMILFIVGLLLFLALPIIVVLQYGH